jgi:hypothetical protein
VLRVRKPKPPPAPEHLALEDAVWGPVLGNRAAADGSDSAADRERAYVQLLLAPLLGPQHIPLQQQVNPSLDFLQRLLHCTGCLLSLPDGKAGVAAPLPAVLMPDVTLLPASGPSGTRGPESERAAGPAVCIELKPKCGFINACSTVHPANRGLKHSRSRYQLHQLLKLEEVGCWLRSYLFAGRTAVCVQRKRTCHAQGAGFASAQRWCPVQHQWPSCWLTKLCSLQPALPGLLCAG